MKTIDSSEVQKILSAASKTKSQVSGVTAAGVKFQGKPFSFESQVWIIEGDNGDKTRLRIDEVSSIEII